MQIGKRNGDCLSRWPIDVALINSRKMGRVIPTGVFGPRIPFGVTRSALGSYLDWG